MAQTSLHPISGSFFDSEPVRSQLLRRIRAFPGRVHEALVASRRARPSARSQDSLKRKAAVSRTI